MESLIGRKVRMKYDFPLTWEVFTIIGERKLSGGDNDNEVRIDEVQIRGDFSAMGNPSGEQWERIEKIAAYVPRRVWKVCECCGKGELNAKVEQCPECGSASLHTNKVY